MEYENGDKQIKKLSEGAENKQLEGIIKQEYPRKVENPLVYKRRSFWQWITFRKKKVIANPEMKQPILQLIKDDGFTDIIEGVKAGLFVVNDEKNKKKKGIILSQKKLTTWNIEPYPKMWIAYENEMTPYPMDINYDSEEFLSVLRKLELNRNLLKDEAKLISAKMWFWIGILGLIGLILYFGFSEGWFNSLLGK